jgi:hypothetical protein
MTKESQSHSHTRSKASAKEAAPALDLRSVFHDELPDKYEKRFDMFLIDTGWNAPVSKVVRETLPMIHEMQPQDPLYILSREQSLEVLRRAPEWIGYDPVFVVYDLYAGEQGHSNRYRGFRLKLGMFKHGEQAAARLHEFLRFLAENRAAHGLERCVKRQLHREGFEGMLKVLSETSSEFLA